MREHALQVSQYFLLSDGSLYCAIKCCNYTIFDIRSDLRKAGLLLLGWTVTSVTLSWSNSRQLCAIFLYTAGPAAGQWWHPNTEKVSKVYHQRQEKTTNKFTTRQNWLLKDAKKFPVFMFETFYILCCTTWCPDKNYSLFMFINSAMVCLKGNVKIIVDLKQPIL